MIDDARLTAIGARLVDVADAMAREAEAATGSVRTISDDAREVASCAARLQQAATLIDASVRAQSNALEEAKRTLADNEPAIRALTASVDAVIAISGLIGDIAAQSRMLSLNARIEAARAGDAGRSFAVVAEQMSLLTGQTKSASDEIGSRTRVVAHDIDGACHVMLSGQRLTAGADEIMALATTAAGDQRAAATTIARMADETAERIEDAASAIGRVGSSAVAVRMLARELVRHTGPNARAA